MTDPTWHAYNNLAMMILYRAILDTTSSKGFRRCAAQSFLRCGGRRHLVEIIIWPDEVTAEDVNGVLDKRMGSI